MSDSGDSVCVGGGSSGTDGSIEFGDQPRTKRHRASPSSASCSNVFLVLVASSAATSSVSCKAIGQACNSAAPLGAVATSLQLGAVALVWRFRSLHDSVDASTEQVHEQLLRKCRRRPVKAFLDYVVESAYSTTVLPDDFVANISNQLSESILHSSLNLRYGNYTIDDIAKRHGCGLPTTVVYVSPAVASSVFSGNATVVRSIALSQRNQFDDIIADMPKVYHLQRLLNAMCVNTLAALPSTSVHGCDNSRDFTPYGHDKSVIQKHILPESYMRFLKFSNNLVNRGITADAGLDGLKCYLPESDAEGYAAAAHVPGPSSLERGFKRLDAVSCLLERKRLKNAMEEDSIESIHLHCDASPVTGEEILGMMYELCWRCGRKELLYLPGAVLAFGFTRAIDKGIALLYAIWLVSGPTIEQVVWFLWHTLSLTVDGGVEFSIIKIPDCVAAFFKWLGGHPNNDLKRFINKSRRLMPHDVNLNLFLPSVMCLLFCLCFVLMLL